VTHEFTFRAVLWLYEGKAAWHFVTLPKSVAARIKALAGDRKKAFGTLKVTATIGHTTWKTSIFPDRKRASYLLPIKSLVRQREQLPAGVPLEVRLRIEAGEG